MAQAAQRSWFDKQQARPPFWRKEDPEFRPPVEGELVTRTGNAPSIKRGGMFEHQREWWNSKCFIKALVTGYGGGKTLIGAKRAISLSIYNAPSPVAWVSPSYKVAKRTVVPMMRSLLHGKQQLLGPRFQYEFNKSDLEFHIRYGNLLGIIWIMTGDDPDALKGPNLCGGYIDEPFIQPREVFDQVLARVRDPRARRLEIGLMGTPEELNWGYDICEGEEKGNYDLQLVQASTKANKALPDDYAARLEMGYDEKTALAFVDGQFVSLSKGLVYYAFDSTTCVVDEPDPGHELCVGMDFNVDPMAFIVFWKRGDRMHVVKEYELPNSDTEDACIKLRDDWGARVRDVYPDASGNARQTNAPGGRSDFHILRENGFTVRTRKVNPPRRDRFNAVNGKFKARGADAPTLTISPECKRLKRYLLEYNHENAHKLQHMSHLLDAMGYPVAYLYPVRRPAENVRLVGH